METREVIAGIGVLAFFIIISVIGYKRRLASAWTGTIKKKGKQYDDGGISHRLIIETKEGKTVRLSVRRSFFNSVGEGDRLKKVAGEYNPKKA